MKAGLRFLGFTHGGSVPALQQVRGASQSPHLNAGTNADRRTAQSGSGQPQARGRQPYMTGKLATANVASSLTPKTHSLFQARCQKYVSVCSDLTHNSSGKVFNCSHMLSAHLSLPACQKLPPPLSSVFLWRCPP